ncbi:hypothetical protein JB92DRAFT_2830012 [Gautieria morchelliformis]|nr:hypothetical protein JB92DRAFT_2830012 [Gautieria morchelliformis]
MPPSRFHSKPKPSSSRRHAYPRRPSSRLPTRHTTATSATLSRSGSVRFSSPSSELTWGGESHGHATASAGSVASLSGTDSEHEAGQKSKRDPLSRPARHFAHTVEMWRRFETIMDAGLGDPSDADPDDTQFRTAWQQYKLLIEICPRLTDEIQARSIEEASSIMENARASGRGEDIKHVKDLMQSLRSFHPALKANDKESRGFNHPQMGRLLVSAPKLQQWDEDEEFRWRVREGIEIFRLQDFPVFLYEDDKVDPNNLLLGFLRSDILVHAYHAIIIGPSAIEGRGPSAHATKKGNVQLNNMNDISIASLSYIATLVHFGLSSQGTFNVGGDLGRFNYLAFHRAIEDLLSHERMGTRCEVLLRWWKGKIFPNAHEHVAPKGDTAYGQMLAQLEFSE